MKCKLRLFSTLFLVLAFPLSAAAQIEVSPLALGFGNVEVGTSAPGAFSVTNVGMDYYEISGVELSCGSAFSVAALNLPVILTTLENPTNASLIIPVEFAPTGEGDQQCTLIVNGIAVATLSGTGVAVEPPPPVSIADILAFFDESVANGTLTGSGPGNSADGRRGALRNMIEAAGDLLGGGETAEACAQLMDTYSRTDGLDRPPEFVEGPAAAELAGMIWDLLAALGCE